MITMNRLNQKLPLKRGDVILILFPSSDLVSFKTRPVLVIQTINLKTEDPNLIVAVITSQMSKANHLGRIRILLRSSEGKASGLLCDSVVLIDKLINIKGSEVKKKIGFL